MNGRLLRCKGKIAALQRMRRPGDRDMRSNMSAGAISGKARLNRGILEIADTVRPRLVQDGMFLVGLDIVGDKLIEVNVLSPGGIESAEHYEGVSFASVVISAVERKVAHMRDYNREFDNLELATL
jgi:glutathione synthase